ncbi:carbohydrate ABC transporter permease [Ruminococcaceae bacterium OttesenSCG-928-A11]|nr:carbohydrate ABC transporter permease [Ruminococcaceae bacterium OttesenSCG-928-A11]
MAKVTAGYRPGLSASRVAFNIFNYAVFAALLVLCIYPLWYVLIYSISDPDLAAKTQMVLVPRGLSLRSFQMVMGLEGVLPALGVSVARTVAGTVCTVFASMLLGYLFTKRTMPARRLLYRALIVTMYVSGGMIPTYLVFHAYGLLNTFAAYIVPAVVAPYYVILVKTFIEQLPASLEESAMIDGAGPLTSFLRIVFPLSRPIVATIAIYSAVAQWNAWFDNHIYTFNNKALTTLQYMLYNYLNESERLLRQMQQSSAISAGLSQHITPASIRMTVTIITVIPILLVYPFLQRHFMKGLLIGAVKG